MPLPAGLLLTCSLSSLDTGVQLVRLRLAGNRGQWEVPAAATQRGEEELSLMAAQTPGLLCLSPREVCC